MIVRIIIRFCNFIRFKLKRNIHVGRVCLASFYSSIKAQFGGKVKIGTGFHSRRNVTVHADGGEIFIDNNCFINEGCVIVSKEKVSIGENCKFGPGVYIYDHNHGIKDREEYSFSPVSIGNNVWIGANAVILKGSKIGDNCVIGASTVVSGEVKENTIVYNKREMIFKPIE